MRLSLPLCSTQDLLVFVFVDALADAVLLTIDPALLRLGEVAVVLGHISLFAILHIRLALFEVRRLLCAQFTAADAVRDALLLVLFASVDFIHTRMARIDNARTRA